MGKEGTFPALSRFFLAHKARKVGVFLKKTVNLQKTKTGGKIMQKLVGREQEISDNRGKTTAEQHIWDIF